MEENLITLYLDNSDICKDEKYDIASFEGEAFQCLKYTRLYEMELSKMKPMICNVCMPLLSLIMYQKASNEHMQIISI